jgi:hypothetical protein
MSPVLEAFSKTGVGLAEFFIKDFKASGGEIVKEQKYSTGDKDFKPQLTSIKAAKPDAIFVPGYWGGFPHCEASASWGSRLHCSAGTAGSAIRF